MIKVHVYKSTPKDSNKGFLSSANNKQPFNLEHPRKNSRLGEKKSPADQVVGATLVLTEPSTDLAGTSSGYSFIKHISKYFLNNN